MKKIATIWRESVYNNDFRCNICGTKIANEKGEILRQRGDIFEGILQCPRCFNVVASFEEMTGLQGYLGDYLKNRGEQHD